MHTIKIMNLFALGLMPAFILLQFFYGRTARYLLWHVGVGFLLYLPFLVIRAVLLNAGFSSDNLTFSSEWLYTFVIDYVLPVLYVALVLPIFMYRKIVIRDEVYICTLLASFFVVDSIMFYLFKTSADGAYEYLLRPLYYLLLVLMQAKLYRSFSAIVLLCIALVMAIAPMTDVFFFMNQSMLALVSIVAVVGVGVLSMLVETKSVKASA
jgi:hypothetical protein